MSDKFEDFLSRLEMPMPEPKIVGIVDKVMDVQIACIGFACTCIQNTMLITLPTQVPRRGKEIRQ